MGEEIYCSLEEGSFWCDECDERCNEAWVWTSGRIICDNCAMDEEVVYCERCGKSMELSDISDSEEVVCEECLRKNKFNQLLDDIKEPNPHGEIKCNCDGKCGNNCKCKTNEVKGSLGYDIYIGKDVSSVYMNGTLIYQCCCTEEESVRHLFEKFKQTAEFKIMMDEQSEDWNPYVIS